jgi:hypothetical protein
MITNENSTQKEETWKIYGRECAAGLLIEAIAFIWEILAQNK